MKNLPQKLAVLYLVGISTILIVTHWWTTINIEKGSDALDRWEANLQPARDALPIKRGIIGFVGEWDVQSIEWDPADQETEFILTQYALAPLILVRGAVAEWNVAILSREAFEIWENANPDQFEVTHLKHNIYILHRLDTR